MYTDGWRAPPLLPLDILYHILAIHRQDWPDDIATLTACTLVCKEWRDVARGYAFSTITVGSGADGRRFDDFFNFIKHSPHSACYIKELILKYKPKPTLRLVPPYKKLALAFPYPRRIPFNNPVGHPVFYESPPLGSVDLARLDLSAFLAAAPKLVCLERLALHHILPELRYSAPSTVASSSSSPRPLVAPRNPPSLSAASSPHTPLALGSPPGPTPPAFYRPPTSPAPARPWHTPPRSPTESPTLGPWPALSTSLRVAPQSLSTPPALQGPSLLVLKSLHVDVPSRSLPTLFSAIPLMESLCLRLSRDTITAFESKMFPDFPELAVYLMFFEDSPPPVQLSKLRSLTIDETEAEADPSIFHLFEGAIPPDALRSLHVHMADNHSAHATFFKTPMLLLKVGQRLETVIIHLPLSPPIFRPAPSNQHPCSALGAALAQCPALKFLELRSQRLYMLAANGRVAMPLPSILRSKFLGILHPQDVSSILDAVLPRLRGFKYTMLDASHSHDKSWTKAEGILQDLATMDDTCAPLCLAPGARLKRFEVVVAHDDKHCRRRIQASRCEGLPPTTTTAAMADRMRAAMPRLHGAGLLTAAASDCYVPVRTW